MNTVYLFLMLVGAVCAVSFWPLSGAFVNWFWQDEKEEAELILSDERSSTNYSKSFSLPAIGFMFIVLLAIGSLMHIAATPNQVLIVKSLAILYFMFMALVDYRTMMLPDILNYIGLWSGLLIASFGFNPFDLSLQTCVLGAFGAYMVCWLIIQLGYRIFGQIVLGHGDAKYLAMLGAWFGFKSAYLVLAFSAVLSSVYSILRFLFTKNYKLNTQAAFGPFLGTSATALIIYNK